MLKMGVGDIEMSNFQGCMLEGISYQDLVEVFGEPNKDVSENHKIDVEWFGTIHGKVFTIYNYKTGRSYFGGEGKSIEQLNGSDWHIGGFDKTVVKVLAKYLSVSLRKRMSKAKSLRVAVQAFEKQWIFLTLSACDWNKPRAAKVLGVGESTLYRKIREFGIERSQMEDGAEWTKTSSEEKRFKAQAVATGEWICFSLRDLERRTFEAPFIWDTLHECVGEMK